MQSDSLSHKINSKNQHIESLEGLRGISSLSVLGTHVFGFQPFTETPALPHETSSFIASIFPGHLGVLYFFFLSGYVIARAHSNTKNLDFWYYLKKRFVRIWPMYFISIILGALAVNTLGHLEKLNPTPQRKIAVLK